MIDANRLFSEPLDLLNLLAVIILGWLLRAMPKPAPVRASIALGSPQLVAMDPREAVLASRLLGIVAASTMADETWQ